MNRAFAGKQVFDRNTTSALGLLLAVMAVVIGSVGVPGEDRDTRLICSELETVPLDLFPGVSSSVAVRMKTLTAVGYDHARVLLRFLGPETASRLFLLVRYDVDD